MEFSQKYKISTYIINLKSSLARRRYMEDLLSAYEHLNIEFVEAVDGRLFSKEQQQVLFDMDACMLRNGRSVNLGEIGCTLSHRKCYQKLLDSSNSYAFILEDDISIVGDMNAAINDTVAGFMNCQKPRILFLSGDYWYWRKKAITKVFWAVGSYAYFINRAAAERILKIGKPFSVADDWDLYKTNGVELYAIHPYIIDANISDLPSDIQQSYWGNKRSLMSKKNILRSYYKGFIKRCLLWAGHFESKIRNEGK